MAISAMSSNSSNSSNSSKLVELVELLDLEPLDDSLAHGLGVKRAVERSACKALHAAVAPLVAFVDGAIGVQR